MTTTTVRDLPAAHPLVRGVGETFDAIHYGGMAVYKIGILLLNLAPLIAIVVAT